MFFGFRAIFIRSLIGVLMVLPAGVATAVESPWANAGKAEVRLIAGGSSVAGAQLRAGVEIRMARGWHTYWRYPGDAGIPPRFDWSGSSNVASVEIRWPAPERIPIEDGLASIGYSGGVLFPVHVRPADAAKPVALRLKLDFGACEKICVPASAKIALDIPPGSGKRQPALDAAEARVPAIATSGGNQKLGVISAKLERSKPPRAIIEIAAPAGKPFDLFAEGPDDDWALPLPKLIDHKGGRARFTLPLEGAPAGTDPIPSKLRLTLVSGDESIEAFVPLD